MTYSNEPIEIDGKIFQPLLHLLYVEEPDFGCEGVPEDGAVCGSIVAEDAAGRRTMPIEEQTQKNICRRSMKRNRCGGKPNDCKSPTACCAVGLACYADACFLRISTEMPAAAAIYKKICGRYA